MLNEIKEYKSYTENPESGSPRLKPMLLTDGFDKDNKLNGINQIFEIIARYYIYNEPKKPFFKDDVITETGISETKKHLDEWFNGWFQDYYKYHYKLCKKASDKQADKAWEKCHDKWNNIFNSDDDYKAESINYNSIISSALQKGPLKERYCAIKTVSDIKTVEDLCNAIFSCQKGTQNKIKLRTLQNVIAFRLFQLNHPKDQDEVTLLKLRLFGWYGIDSNKGKAGEWCSDRIYYKTEDKTIVKNRSITKYNKMSIDKDFLDQYEFKLIEVNEASKFKDGYTIIKEGDTAPLEIINI